ncbi:mobile element protein [Vibrio astriarenae]|nr:mobile element protein [Vibrio sp. C7]
MKTEGRLRANVVQRQIKYLNNGIESDHAPIKKLVQSAGGFKLRKRAWSTLQGFESLRMLNKDQFDFWLRRDERKTLVRERSTFMNRLFNVEVIFS